MNFKTGDKVVVIAGKDKGKEGKITKVLRSENKIVIEGVNVAKKHVKPNGQAAGSIVEMEAVITSYSIHYTKLYEIFSNSGTFQIRTTSKEQKQNDTYNRCLF